MIIGALLSMATASVTYVLGQRDKIGTVKASASVTLVLCLFIFLLSHFIEFDWGKLFAHTYAGSFVGMTAKERLPMIAIVLAGLLASIVFSMLAGPLKGVGGTLGFSAFLSVSILYFLNNILVKLR